MKAIEIHSKTDESGNLKINYKFNKAKQNVRVLVLVDEDTQPDNREEIEYYESLSNNPAFDFLNEPEEDIYSLNDGEPFND